MTTRRRNQSWPYWLAVWIVVAVTLYAHQAKAETALHLGAYSYHVATGHKVDYTSSHDLFGVEVGPVLAARFRNSYGRPSHLAAYGWGKQWGDWRGVIHIGAVHGYRSCFGDDGDKARVCPVAFPSLHYTRWRVQPGILVFGEAVALSVRIRL